MSDSFAAHDGGFMANWGPEVTQLAWGGMEPLKLQPMTDMGPIRVPWLGRRRPGPAKGVTNTPEEQAVSSRPQLVDVSSGTAGVH